MGPPSPFCATRERLDFGPFHGGGEAANGCEIGRQPGLEAVHERVEDAGAGELEAPIHALTQGAALGGNPVEDILEQHPAVTDGNGAED